MMDKSCYFYIQGARKKNNQKRVFHGGSARITPLLSNSHICRIPPPNRLVSKVSKYRSVKAVIADHNELLLCASNVFFKRTTACRGNLKLSY